MSSSTDKKNNTTFWDKRRNTFKTHKGGWVIGEAVYNHGYSMMDELVGEKSFFQVLLLNITGKLPEKKLTDWLEASFICLSWPDPRIWCNQIGSLAGTARTSPVAAVSMGILASDSRLYGPGTLLAATEFIINAGKEAQSGKTVPNIVNNELARKALISSARPVVVGYARPLAKGDERVTAMERVGRQLGFDIGMHLQLAYDIHGHLVKHHDEGINLAGYCAAFLADQNFTAKEINRIFSTWVHSGVHACYAEAKDRPADSFLPQRCDDIKYTGPQSRQLPKE